MYTTSPIASSTTGYLLFPKFFTELKDATVIMLNSSRPDRDDDEMIITKGSGCKEFGKDKGRKVPVTIELIENGFIVRKA